MRNKEIYHKIVALLFVLLLTATGLKANNDDHSFCRKTIRHGLISSRDLILSPTQWDKTDLIVLGSVSAITAASVFWIDAPLKNYISNNHNPQISNTLNYFEPFANKYVVASVAGFAIHSVVSKNNYSAETALIITESYMLNLVLTRFSKYLTGRKRPWNSNDPLLWNGPSNDLTTLYRKGTSFYSGHASSAFSAASVIAWRYRDITWVPWLSYSLATISTMQRVYNNHHWLSDTIFAAMVGTSIGLFLAKNSENNPYKIYPTLTPNGTAGFSMVIELGRNQ